jgi:lysozyme
MKAMQLIQSLLNGLIASTERPDMMPSAACFALIRKSEGLRLKAYRDPVGVLTIGYGHTGPDVSDSKKITVDEAEALLHTDATHACDSVLKLTNGNVSQGQLDALTDFVFNLGSKRLGSSTLLMKHKAGNYAGAAVEFGKWVYADGRILPGLVKRRAAETHLYLSGDLP